MYVLLASSLLVQSEHILKKKKQKNKHLIKTIQRLTTNKNKRDFEGRICAADEQSSLK